MVTRIRNYLSADLDYTYARCHRTHEFVTNRTCRLCDFVDRQPISPQHNLAANTGLCDRCQINRDHIHGNTANHTCTRTIDKYRCAIGSVTWITICIATGNNTDSHRSVSHKGAAITDGITTIDVLHTNNLAMQSHGWTQIKRSCRCSRWRSAIEHDAWTHAVTCTIGMQ